MQISLFLRVSLGHSITVDFAEVIFTLRRISALNVKSKNYVILDRPRVVPVRRAKAFIHRKVVLLSRVTLPAEAHPSEMSRPPRRVRNPNVNGSLNFAKK